MTRRSKNRRDAREVEALSITLRLRSANLKASAPPDQYEHMFFDWCTLDYNAHAIAYFQGALLQNNPSHISDLVTTHLERAVPYTQQKTSSIMQIVTKYVQEQPIFLCYYDNWPIKSYIKSIISTQTDSDRKLNRNVARDERAMNRAAGVALPQANPENAPQAPPAPAPAPPPAVAQPAAPTLAVAPDEPNAPPPIPPAHPELANAPGAAGAAGDNHGAHEPEAARPNQSAAAAERPESDRDTPPAPALPYRKRGRGDPNRNLPDIQQTAPSIDIPSPGLESGDPPMATRARTTTVNAKAGPGPNTTARQNQTGGRKKKK
ncbi:hypothetical protein FRC10_000951 [Ceratobasidium sp. 414]|nr:hypothetical protein FRC10_000951 [Ceratobasidium sp. 414]